MTAEPAQPPTDAQQIPSEDVGGSGSAAQRSAERALGATPAFARGIGIVWIVLLVALPIVLVGVIGKGMIDLDVYRAGGRAWLDNARLYADNFVDRPGTHHLPFTYPPFATIVFAGLSVLGDGGAQVVMVLISYVSVTLVAWLVLRNLGVGPRSRWPIAAALAILVWMGEPFWATLAYGQINMLLMLLVVLDCLAVRDPRLRGLLTGVAAAIKLTPAVFVLFFLFRREYRSAANVIAGFVGCGLFAWALAPSDSHEYWFHALEDPSRPGSLAYARNQSIRGVLHRWTLPPHVESALWVLAAVAVVVLAWSASRRYARADGEQATDSVGELVTLVAVAIVGLLVSPVSWGHHWVWVAPGVLLAGWLLWTAHARAGLAVVALVVSVYVITPFHWLPSENGAETHWSVWQNAAGDGYVWAGLIALIWLAFFAPCPADRAPNPATTLQ